MKKGLLILAGLFTLTLGFFYPYFSGQIHFPSGGDFVAYFREFQNYGSTERIYESVGIWYEPGYFFLLYLLQMINGDFSLSFLVLEILMVNVYFFAFYFLINSFSRISTNMKLIMSLLFSFSVPQILIFTFSIRKQFFAGIFFLVFLALLQRFPKKIIILGILFGMLFFSHRGVSFYLCTYFIILLIQSRFDLKNIYNKGFLKSFVIGITINIAYLTPFVATQYQLLKDTINAFFRNSMAATMSLSGASVEYLARGWDMFGGDGNTLVSYFLGMPIIFLIIISNLKVLTKNNLGKYAITINSFIYLGSILAGRMAHFANMLFFTMLPSFFAKRKKIMIIFVCFTFFIFFHEVFEKQMKTRYFYQIDSKMLNFYEQVPRENTFIFDFGNPFVGYSGYTNSNFFIRTTLNAGIQALYLEKKLSSVIKDADALFQVYGYKTVILPESLRGKDIYVVFGYYLGNGGYQPPGNLKYNIFRTANSQKFHFSPHFEEIKIVGDTGINKVLKVSYPIDTVYRLKKDAPREYVPDDEYVQRVLVEINRLDYE